MPLLERPDKGHSTVEGKLENIERSTKAGNQTRGSLITRRVDNLCATAAAQLYCRVRLPKSLATKISNLCNVRWQASQADIGWDGHRGGQLDQNKVIVEVVGVVGRVNATSCSLDEFLSVWNLKKTSERREETSFFLNREYRSKYFSNKKSETGRSN